jgi:hypothetical protein
MYELPLCEWSEINIKLRNQRRRARRLRWAAAVTRRGPGLPRQTQPPVSNDCFVLGGRRARRHGPIGMLFELSPRLTLFRTAGAVFIVTGLIHVAADQAFGSGYSTGSRRIGGRDALCRNGHGARR